MTRAAYRANTAELKLYWRRPPNPAAAPRMPSALSGPTAATSRACAAYSHAGIVAVGVPSITRRPRASAASTIASSNVKLNTPSDGSMWCHMNSPTRTMSAPKSCLMASRSAPISLSGHCSG